MGGHELVVEPPVVNAVGTDVNNMGFAIKDAHNYLTTYVPASEAGGFLFNEASDLIGGVRATIEPEYADAQAEVKRIGEHIIDMAVTYRRTDAAQEREFDRDIGLIGVDGGTGFPRVHDQWRDDLGDDLPDVEAGYSQSSSAAWASFDVPPVSAYEESWTNNWSKIRDGIDWLTNLGQDLEAMSILGLENPLASFEEKFHGDWLAIGSAAEAIRILGSFWRDLGAEVLATEGRTEGRWEGKAAAVCSQFLLSFAEAAEEHGTGMEDISGKIESIGGFMYSVIDPLLDAANSVYELVGQAVSLVAEFGPGIVGRVIDSIRNPTSIFDNLFGAAKDAADQLGGLISRILKLVGKVVLLVDLLIASCWMFRDMWEGLGADDYTLPRFWADTRVPGLQVGPA